MTSSEPSVARAPGTDEARENEEGALPTAAGLQPGESTLACQAPDNARARNDELGVRLWSRRGGAMEGGRPVSSVHR